MGSELEAGKPVVVVACDVLRTEIEALSQQAQRPVRLHFLEQGLHNDPPKLRAKLQQAIDQVERQWPDAGAIVLGYGLCSRGIEGVATRHCLLVIPRAHDCITLLLGSKETYADYVRRHPGTYWYSPGWNRCHVPPGPERHAKLLKQYTEKYGEEDAQFLMETEQAWFNQYNRATYVDLGVGATDEDIHYTKRCAEWLRWGYDRQHGSDGLVRAMLSGRWDDERFLILNPGQEAKMTADEQIITLNVPAKAPKEP